MNTDAPTRQTAAAAALAPHAEGDPQVLTSITDEEILALTGDGIGFDLPWVTAREARPEGFSRDEARLSAARSLVARGLFAPESAVAAIERREAVGDPEAWTPNILLTGIVARRMLVPLQIRADGPTVERVSIASMFVDHDGTVLQELVSPDGIHHFSMSDTAHAADVLRHRIDPGGRAAGSPVTDVVTGSYEQLEASDEIGPLLHGAEHRTRVRVTDRRDRLSPSLLVASGPAGVVVVQEAEDGELLEAAAASAAQLEELALSLFTIAPQG